jgi:hypothetical protein
MGAYDGGAKDQSGRRDKPGDDTRANKSWWFAP